MEDYPHAEQPPVSSLEKGLADIRSTLDEEVATLVLPEGSVAAEIQIEDYRSATFTAANYHYMPERYGHGDRRLAKVTLEDGKKVFVVSGKISSSNPYEVGHAAGGGIDLRRVHTVAYVWDGEETIVEYQAGHEPGVYTGEYGQPDMLLEYITEALGTMVAMTVVNRE